MGGRRRDGWCMGVEVGECVQRDACLRGDLVNDYRVQVHAPVNVHDLNSWSNQSSVMWLP